MKKHILFIDENNNELTYELKKVEYPYLKKVKESVVSKYEDNWYYKTFDLQKYNDRNGNSLWMYVRSGLLHESVIKIIDDELEDILSYFNFYK